MKAQIIIHYYNRKLLSLDFFSIFNSKVEDTLNNYWVKDLFNLNWYFYFKIEDLDENNQWRERTPVNLNHSNNLLTVYKC